MSTPLEVARAEIAKNPGLLLTYLIRAVAHWSRAKGIENYVPVVDQLQQTVESAMEANLGQLKARHDFMYANINAAMSLFSDLVASKRYPGLYALAEEVTRDALHIPREIRYNTRYLTSLFHQLLTKNEIVSGDDLDSGHVIIRANVKTPSSLLSKALIDPLVYESITGAIKNIDPSAHLPLESSPRFVRAISALDALQCIRANALQSSDTGDKDIFSGIEAQVRIAMIAQDDIIRSRIDFRDSNGLNQAMLKIKDIFRSVQVENISKKKARAEVFAATYGKDGNTAQCYPLDGSQGQDAVGENVAGWITDFVTSLPVPRSFYAAIHAYLPLQYKDGALYIMKNVSEKQRESAGGEMQMTLQAIRPACNLSRRFYDIWAKVAGSLRLDWGLIQKVQKEACIKLKSQTA
jgi:hypothetical protein